MKILVLTSLYPNKAMPTYGIFSRERDRHQKSLCEIQVLAPVRFDFFLGQHKHVPLVEHDDHMTVYHPRFINIPKFMKWSDGFLFALCVLPVAIKIKRGFHPDLIDAHWGYPDGIAAFLIGKLLKLPVVVTLLGSDVNVLMKGPGRGWLLRWYLKRMHKIIVVSKALKIRLVDYGIQEHKIVVIETGVDTAKFCLQDRREARRKLGLNQESKIILAVGNLVWIKGPDILIEAFRINSYRSAHLIFVGDGSMRRRLEEQIRAYPQAMQSRIRFIGHVPHEAISLWMASCDVLVLSSRNEGFPNVLLEAMSCGRPVVASRVGGVGEVVDSNEVGFTVPAEDTKMLSIALERALEKVWNEQAIRRHIVRFSWEATAYRYVQVWGEMRA